MSVIFKIPLSPRAQVFRCDIGGVTYTLHLRWNPVCESWVIDIHDANDDGTLGLSGIPLVTGTDLLGQFRYLGIGGGVPLITMTIGPGHSPDEVPTYDNLGVDGQLYFKTLDPTP